MFIRMIRLQGKDITFIHHWIYEPTTSPQWRIQGRGPGARTPLFLGQSEARRAEKIRVWMTPPPPLSEGLDPPLSRLRVQRSS